MTKKVTCFLLFSILALSAFATTGCSYAGVATTSDGYVVVPVNNAVLGGVLRKVFVCKVTQMGLQDCKEGSAP